MKCLTLTLGGLSLLLAAPTVAEARRPTSKAQLRIRAMRAIKKNRPKDYVKLLFTPRDVKRYCPERPLTPKRYQRMVAKVRRRVAGCHKLINWKRAKLLRVQDRGKKRRVTRCSGKVYKVSDITLYYRQGTKVVRVRLDDPIQIGRHYVFADDPRCRIDRSAP